MKTTPLLLVVLAYAGFSCSRREPDPAPPVRSHEVSNEFCSRFLFLAVFEGLWEDGADSRVIQALLKNPGDHFVAKCPICTPVSHAFLVYAKSEDVLGYASRGNGWPKAIQDELISPDRAIRLKALEKLVDRYVARRLESVRMSDEDKKSLESRLIMSKKLGMTYKDKGFGDFCPSCNGATKFIK
jgi:hypothetical protein